MMKVFLIKILSYLLILLSVAFFLLEISSMVVKKRGFLNYQTESNLLVLNPNKNYDLVFMGISHARNFSRHKNHLRIEKILDKTILNIGQGYGACGVNEQLFYLDYFYYRKNRAKNVVFILSPPLLFAESLAQASYTFDEEPFDFQFLYRYLFFKSENKKERIISYLQSKLSKEWIRKQPFSYEFQNGKLNKIDSVEVEKGQDLAYGEGLSMKRFRKSKQTIKQTIKLAIKNGSKVTLIIPPALFGKWRGHDLVMDFAKKMQIKDKVRLYDYSEAVLEPKFYYDHHHLNSDGVSYFSKQYFKPIFN